MSVRQGVVCNSMLAGVIMICLCTHPGLAQSGQRVPWTHLSSTTGQIPAPDVGRQVATLILDIDKDGVNDFVVASYEKMAWFRRAAEGWTRYAVENGATGVRMEAGGDVLDLDGDGDLDILMAAQSKAGEIWWWENPHPDFSPDKPWKRYQVIAVGGTHHDQIFGDFDGDGKVELAFWYNVGDQLFLAEIPADPTRPWPVTLIAKLSAGKQHPEGFAKIDLNGDGDLDILQKDFQQERRVDVWLNGGTRPGARGIGTGRSFHGRVGLQLYSLRDIFKDNVPLGLQFTRNFGFVEVELAGTYGLTPTQFCQRLQWYGLKPIGGHWSYEQWEKDPAAVVKEAKELGLPYAGCAWIPHEGQFDEAACRRAAAVFNNAGKAAAAQGIKFYYHNHGYEFVPHGSGTLFDLLVQETKPELVTYQMDVFWTVHPGQDPLQLLHRYPNRWELFHIKDLKKGVATGKLTGSEDVNNDVTLGTGQIDLPRILRTAQELGVKHYFIEDESPIATTQIPQSLRFLESLSW